MGKERPSSGKGGETTTTGQKTRRKDRRNGGRERGERDLLHRTQGPITKSVKPTLTSTELLEQAEQCLREGRPDEALPHAKRALATLQPSPGKPTIASLPALNLLAEINLEIGEVDTAREYFLQAVDLDPNGTIPESQGGGVEKFLWLAQLSEEGGQDSVDWFEKGAEVLRREISRQTDGIDQEGEQGDEVKALIRKLANVLCGIVEIYMTDLSFQPDAESHCESLITSALLSSPSDPSPLQTLASIRISQSRIPEARSALSSSLALWKDLPPSPSAESDLIPDFPTRISLARLLMEVEMEEDALGVLERLVMEDDRSVEAWYLGGWCLYLLAQKDQPDAEGAAMERNGIENSADKNKEKMRIASLLSSREWLKQSLTLFSQLEYEDDRLREHARELVGELDRALEGYDSNGGDEGEGEIAGEEEEGWESEDDGDGEGEEEDQEMDGA